MTVSVALDASSARAGARINGNYWIESAGPASATRGRPNGTITADVVIVGGGFSGLWTAYYLLKQAPGLDIVVVEKDHCGFGASGRNGGWCSPRFPVDPGALIRRHGAGIARECVLAASGAVEEVGRVLEEEDIDAEYRTLGLLVLARRPAHLQSLAATQSTFERLGLGAHNRLVSREEAYEHIRATEVYGALASPHGALIHPVKLVRGLAKSVERLGGVIFEGTNVTAVEHGAHAAAITPFGSIRARRALVIANEAYSTSMSGFSRDLLPISSMIVVTEPLTQQQWNTIGWSGGEGVSSCSPLKPYLTKTTDGRVLFGSRGAPYSYGSSMPESALTNAAMYEQLRAKAREWFPTLSSVRFTHAWGGYLGVPRDWMPFAWFDKHSKVARLGGYTGRGVATSNMAGRLLAGLINGAASSLEKLPISRRAIPLWEREPLRFMAVRYVQSTLTRMEAADAKGEQRPWGATLADRLSSQ
jgi:glycine/D-amino acid oxidase-like deaminating enzyme